MCMQLPTYVESVTCVLFKHICVGICVCMRNVLTCNVFVLFRTNTNVHVFHEIWFSIVCTSCLNVYIYMPFLLFNRMNTFQLHLHLHMLTIYVSSVCANDWLHIWSRTYRGKYKKIDIQSHTVTYSHIHIHTDRQAGRQTDIQTYIHTYRHAHIQTTRHADIQTYTRTDAQTYRHTDICRHTHTYIHTYILTYIHTYILYTHADMHACMHAYRHSGIYVHIHIITYNFVITYIVL